MLLLMQAAVRRLWLVYTSVLGPRMHRDGYLLLVGHVQRAVHAWHSRESPSLLPRSSSSRGRNRGVVEIALDLDEVEEEEREGGDLAAAAARRARQEVLLQVGVV